MKALWAAPAEADLDRRVRHIADDDIDAALRVEDLIVVAVSRLEAHRRSGRSGRWGDTRDLAVARTAYVVIHELRDDRIEGLRIMHGAPDWPPVKAL